VADVVDNSSSLSAQVAGTPPTLTIHASYGGAQPGTTQARVYDLNLTLLASAPFDNNGNAAFQIQPGTYHVSGYWYYPGAPPRTPQGSKFNVVVSGDVTVTVQLYDQGHAVLLAATPDKSPPYTWHDTVNFVVDVANEGNADTIFVRVNDLTITAILGDARGAVDVVHMARFTVPAVVQGPNGSHLWKVETGHVE